jgi:hypothetical protein
MWLDKNMGSYRLTVNFTDSIIPVPIITVQPQKVPYCLQ